MRWLGMTAAIVTLVAVVMNSIWFVRRGLGLGGFFSIAWPAALAAFGVVAFALVLGFVSVRALNRPEDETESGANGASGRGESPSPAGGGAGRGTALGSSRRRAPGKRN